MCSDAPDTTRQGEAALKTAELSKEQLDWAKSIYAETAPQREAASKRANEVSDLQMQATRKGIELADSYDQYNKSTFQPLERQLVRDAQQFDTEGQREELAGKAVGDVRQSFATARDIGIRDLSRRGVNPNDGGYGSVAKQLALGEALGGAGAATKARQDALTLGRAMKMDAVSLGRGLPGQQATAASLAMNQGNSAAGNAGAALAPSNQAQIMLGNAYGGARQGYGQASNIYGDISRAEAGADAANSSAAGGLAGAAMTAAALF